MRVKRGVAAHKRHRKLFTTNKGYRGRVRNVFKRAKEAWLKAGQHAYKGRKLKKRTFRRLWIVRLNNALRQEGITYSAFIAVLTREKVEVNRKSLSEMAIHQPECFKDFVRQLIKK